VPRLCTLHLKAVVGFVFLTTGLSPVHADEEVTVPARVQAQLLAGVASFQTNLRLSSEGVVQILVLTRSGDTESDHAARQLVGALADMRKIVHRPHRETAEPFQDGPWLAATCRAREISIVYVSPGLGDQVAGIAQALRGSGVLTAGAVPRFVGRGIVLGFDLVSGRPEMLLNATQMKIQDVRFPPNLLRLMKVSE
jgi:hypothetical protein